MTSEASLTKRQRRVLQVIEEYAQEYGYPPTIREIGELVGISSTSVVSYNLKVLQRKGRLTRNPDVSRGLRLVAEQNDEVQAPMRRIHAVPLLGAIAAGQPIPVPDSDFSPTDFEEIALTPDIISSTEGVYALEVHGDSMIDALINDGDIVIMRHQLTAENGDMVAAWIKDERSTTLKRFYWERGQNMVRLQPANPNVAPIYVHPSNLEIQGRVVGVIRRMD
jgi:repressor LexA